MTRSEYEERRRALEEQVRADIALIQAAHEARLRSLERLWQAETEGDSSDLGPIPAVVRSVPSAGKRKPTHPRGQVLDDLWDILPQLPEVFERSDVIKALGYEPSRPSLTRALLKLRDEGHIATEGYGQGGGVASYRRVGVGAGGEG